jgi:heme/copper-type cytochrome/quinol oxidase subunit 2
MTWTQFDPIRKQEAVLTRTLNPSYIRNSTFYLFVATFALGMAGCAKKSQDSAARVIPVTMKKGYIAPKQIQVKLGENVKLNVSTLDEQHGFDVPEMNISEPINPGKPAEIALDTSKKGTFKVECGIMCGSRHDDMKAEIVVE